MVANNKFDLDLKFGEEGEQWLKLLADERTLEVKRDRMWAKTGNIFVEFECSGKPSGLFVTQADYFSYILSKDGINVCVFIWKTDIIKPIMQTWIDTAKYKIVTGGDGGRVKGLVVPISALGGLIYGA